MLTEAIMLSASDWRIPMLAQNNGFPVSMGADDFGFAFSGPLLHGKAISIKWLDGNVLAFRVPSAVARELAQESAAENAFRVDENGFVTVADAGERAGTTIRRIAALFRAMPDTPLVIYRQKTASMPESTEAEYWAKRRVGQGIFRAALDDFWQERCAVTGISDRDLLRASHIKDWAECDTDEERLNVFNGFLLVAHIDAAFDAKLITFDDEGEIKFSPKLSEEARALIGENRRVTLLDGHKEFLEYHRQIFEGKAVEIG